MGVLRSVAYFINKFITGYVPNQADYADLMSSLAHKTEDKHKMGGGLKEHEVDRPYAAGEACLVDGRIKISRFPQNPGAYNADNWTDYNSTVDSLGINPWQLGEELGVGIQRINRNAIYETLGPIEGSDADIEPGVTEGWEDFWQVLVYSEGGIIPVLVSGFVKFNTVYEYTGNLAPKGLYRALPWASGFDGGYKLSIASFASDLAEDKWRLVALRESSGASEVINITRGALLVLLEDEEIEPNQQYRITDAAIGSGLIVTGKTPSQISSLALVEGTQDEIDLGFPGRSGLYDIQDDQFYIIGPFMSGPTTPTVNYDSSLGIEVGYVFRDTTTRINYECKDNSVGAAIWKPTDLVPFKVVLSKTDILAGNFVEIFPSPGSGYAWALVEAWGKYHWDLGTEEFDGGAPLVIICPNAAVGANQAYLPDSFLLSTSVRTSRFANNSLVDEQLIEDDALLVGPEGGTSSTTGDVDVTVWGLARILDMTPPA